MTKLEEDSRRKAEDETRLIRAAVKEIGEAIERARRCAEDSYGEKSGAEVAHTIRTLISL